MQITGHQLQQGETHPHYAGFMKTTTNVGFFSGNKLNYLVIMILFCLPWSFNDTRITNKTEWF